MVKIRFALTFLALVMLTLSSNGQLRRELIFSTDTLINWNKNSFYFITQVKDGYILSDWKTDNCQKVDFYFNPTSDFFIDTIIKKKVKQGLITMKENGDYFRLLDEKLYYYNSQKKKEKLIAKLFKHYHGIKYQPTEDFYNPYEGLNLIYNSFSNSVLVGIMPHLYNQLRDTSKLNLVHPNAGLILSVNLSTKQVNILGKIDSIYNRQNLFYSGRYYFSTNDSLLLLTQKATPLIQIVNLRNKQIQREASINTKTVKGTYSNYINYDYKKTFEEQLKILIESPSTGDIFYLKSKKIYLVLRSDSISDTTWHTQNNFSFKSTSYVKNKYGGFCPVWSKQFWNQMNLYKAKPVYIQIYDEDFNFIQEVRTPYSNKVRFVGEHNDFVYLYHPSYSRIIYKIQIK